MSNFILFIQEGLSWRFELRYSLIIYIFLVLGLLGIIFLIKSFKQESSINKTKSRNLGLLLIVICIVGWVVLFAFLTVCPYGLPCGTKDRYII
jgi:Na+/proline symporter